MGSRRWPKCSGDPSGSRVSPTRQAVMTIDQSALDEAGRYPPVWKAIERCLPRYPDGRAAVANMRTWMIDANARDRINVAYRRIATNRLFGIELVPEASRENAA